MFQIRMHAVLHIESVKTTTCEIASSGEPRGFPQQATRRSEVPWVSGGMYSGVIREDRVKPRDAGRHSGQPRPGLPAVQCVSREKQEPRMKYEHRHDPKVGPSPSVFKPAGQAATFWPEYVQSGAVIEVCVSRFYLPVMLVHADHFLLLNCPLPRVEFPQSAVGQFATGLHASKIPTEICQMPSVDQLFRFSAPALAQPQRKSGFPPSRAFSHS